MAIHRVLLSIALGIAPSFAFATSTVYSFNFSSGGTGTLTYNSVTGVANPITMDFGSFGSISTDFGASLTATVFGAPPQEAVVQNGTFFALWRAGAPYASVRLYSNKTFCVEVLPENGTCEVQGTYRIALNLPPDAYSGTYALNFSGAGTGHFTYDGSTGTVSALRYDFGAYGLGATSFGSSLTALVFGNPPTSRVIQDNTFFSLSGGSAYGVRLRTNGIFCIRPDAATCGADDLFSGTYNIARTVPGSLTSGTNVVAVPQFVDENNQPVADPPDVVLTFDSVTQAGSLLVTLVSPGSPSAPAMPFGFALAGSAWLYDITTTSNFNGGVTVCLPYDDAGVNESVLRLLHRRGTDGTWEDVTSPGSPDTTNNVICGRTSTFSAFGTAVERDIDGDGLLDRQELTVGTNPIIADTDGDGLNDGTEVNVALTNPLAADTDGDGLTDGIEVNNLNTNPNNADSDGDGVADGVDPSPLTPGVTTGFLESELRRLAAVALAYRLDLMDAPNDNARKGRRNALANQLVEAANLIAAGRDSDAVSQLDGLLGKLDDAASPPDWMQSGTEKTLLRNNIVLLRSLIPH